MQYTVPTETIAFHLGVIEGQLKSRSFEEDMVLALLLLRRLWSQFSGEFPLSDTFGDPGNLLQTHARIERHLFLDFLAGSPWPPLRNAVFLLERLFRALPAGGDEKVPLGWYSSLAAALEVMDASSAGSPLDCLCGAVDVLFEHHPTFSEGPGETVVRSFNEISVHSFQSGMPSSSWAFNLAGAIMCKRLGLISSGTPLPSLARREVFRTDIASARRRAIIVEMLDCAACAVVGDLDSSARIVRTAVAELRRGRKHSRSADAYILLAGAGTLSVRQLAVLLGMSNEGARKTVAQLVNDGLARACSASAFAANARPGIAEVGKSQWDTSLFAPAPMARGFGGGANDDLD